MTASAHRDDDDSVRRELFRWRSAVRCIARRICSKSWRTRQVVRSRRFCQAHSPEHCEARGLMLCVKAGRIGQTCLHRIPRDSGKCARLRFCVPSRIPGASA